MITRIKAQSGAGVCEISVGSGALKNLKSEIRRCLRGTQFFVIYDANLYALHGRAISRSLGSRARSVRELVVPSGERYKSTGNLVGLYDFLLSEKIARDDLVLACGGGVTSDLTGYAAATTLRGIRWGVVTTTLLGMVDAAIGGKTGINHSTGKNLIGAFWQPSFVISDTNLLKTLPEREFVGGLGEVAKTVGLAGPGKVKLLERYLSSAGDQRERLLDELIVVCARYKASVVKRDEREAGLRAVLNFGHTFAHGIEHALGYGRMRHGEAVMLGLAAALALGARKEYLDGSLGSYRALIDSLLTMLPRRKIDPEAVMEAMALDKKRSRADQKYVLLERPGKPVVCGGIAKRTARAALDEALAAYSAARG